MFITIIAYPTSRIKAWDLRAVALGLHWGGGAQEETYQTTDPPSDINLGPHSAPYNTPSPGAQNVLLRHYTSTASKADPGFKMSTMATLNQVSVRHSYAYRALPRVHMQAHKIRLTAHARIPLSDTTIKYTMLVISFHSKTRFIFSSAVIFINFIKISPTLLLSPLFYHNKSIHILTIGLSLPDIQLFTVALYFIITYMVEGVKSDWEGTTHFKNQF